MLRNIFSRRHIEMLFLLFFLHRTGFVKVQNVFTLYEILFSGWGGSGGGGGGNKKNIANLSSAELAQRMEKING